MKKTIALFLAAALLSVGLIVSCGGGDEPPPDNKPTTEKYTVSFNTDGGTPDKIDSVEVNAGSAVGGTKWPDDPTKDGYLFDGWFDGDELYTSGKKIEKNVELKAKYSLRPVKDLGGFTTFGGAASQKGWASTGLDDGKDLEFEEIQSAKYIVLHTRGGDSAERFNDINVVIQSGGNSWGWGTSQTKIDGVDFARDADKDIFIVIDITKIRTYEDFIKGTSGKFLVLYGTNMNLSLGLQAGYLSYQTLAKPAAAVELKGTNDDVEGVYGFVTEENILGLTLPTTYVTVSFNTDGGTPAVADVKVGSGKSLSVQFPTWVKRDGYALLGWVVGAKEYTASTPITGNVTLKALWEEVPLPTFDPNKDITQVSINLGTNAIGFGGGEYAGAPPYDLALFTDSKYLVLALLGSNANNDGFGGMQFAVQSSLNPSEWNQTNSADWSSFANANTGFVFIVVELEKLKAYTTISTDAALTGAKIVLNYGIMPNFKGAWVTSETLDTDSFTPHGGNFANGGIFITREIGLE